MQGASPNLILCVHMDGWQNTLNPGAAEMERAIREALALTSDEAVREEIERLAMLPRFGGFTWLWAPALAKRDRVMFRPLILSAFDTGAVDGKGNAFDAWTGKTAAALQAMLDEADRTDDIELTRRLYGWMLSSRPHRDAWWRKDLVKRFRAASTPATRHVALAKVDAGAWLALDPDTALALWQIDHVAARKFILAHLPWDAQRAAWQPVLDRSRDADPEFHFELYRKIVDEKSWRDDVLALPGTPELSAELERRHPARWSLSPAGVFHALLDKHGDIALAYVQHHVGSIGPRWSWHGRIEGKGLPDLLELATRRGWTDLWAALLRTSATRELFDAEVRKLVRAGDRARLERLPGRGREFHGAGWSFALTQILTDETACALYATFPALARGPYRIHVTPTQWADAFPKLVSAAIAAGDHDLIDYLASRIAMQSSVSPSHAAATAALTAHYEALPEAAFVMHAATALSRMPAGGIWSYKSLIGANALAHMLFERTTARYLGDGAAVRDLLESPQIQVQLLAFRVLGQDDRRAREIAAAHVDLLQATLLRRLHAASRRLAFGALRSAASHDEATARYLLGRMRDALELPEKRYPVEELVGLIGAILHRWPALRGVREQPVVHGASAVGAAP
jgi:hypothetical protein